MKCSLLTVALNAVSYGAVAAVSQVEPPHVYSGWQYERTVTLAAKAPEAEQCVVLDVATFAQAAPGLRDLRLLQDGREIAYALDESHDEAFDRASSIRAGGGEPGDRALYETSLIIPALPSNWPGPQPFNLNAQDHASGWFYGEGELPAHVPVERIGILPRPVTTAYLALAAWQQGDLRNREELDTVLTPQRPSADFTIGANLQVPAGINIGVHGAMPFVQAFVLEMRRRELCFQPLSASPLLLLAGNENARPVHFDYAAHFHPSATPLLATLGPVRPNPAYQVARDHWTPRLTRLQRLLVLCACGIALFTGLVRAAVQRR